MSHPRDRAAKLLYSCSAAMREKSMMDTTNNRSNKLQCIIPCCTSDATTPIVASICLYPATEEKSLSQYIDGLLYDPCCMMVIPSKKVQVRLSVATTIWLPFFLVDSVSLFTYQLFIIFTLLMRHGPATLVT